MDTLYPGDESQGFLLLSFVSFQSTRLATAALGECVFFMRRLLSHSRGITSFVVFDREHGSMLRRASERIHEPPTPSINMLQSEVPGEDKRETPESIYAYFLVEMGLEDFPFLYRQKL